MRSIVGAGLAPALVSRANRSRVLAGLAPALVTYALALSEEYKGHRQ